VEKTNTDRVQAIFERPSANTECRRPFAPITERRSPRGPWRGCHGWQCGGSNWGSCGTPRCGASGAEWQAGTNASAEAAQPPAANRREQQRTLDRFRQEYNEIRPHEALNMQTPAAVYQPSARMFPTRMAEVDYPGTMLVRSVRPHGHFRWKKEDVFLSEVFWGKRVGLLPETTVGSRSTLRNSPWRDSTAIS
jgi:hypothetical protein